jgi:hypothetical protein
MDLQSCLEETMRINALFLDTRALLVSAVSSAAIVSSACSGGAVVVVTPTGATATAPVTMSVSAATTQGTFMGGLCQVGSFITPAFDIALVAVSTVSVDHLTIQMIDGTHLGGPMVTIPQAAMTNQFGTLVIVGGTQRVFTVRPRMTCGSSPWRSVSAQAAVRDPQGMMYVAAAHAPVP